MILTWSSTFYMCYTICFQCEMFALMMDNVEQNEFSFHNARLKIAVLTVLLKKELKTYRHLFWYRCTMLHLYETMQISFPVNFPSSHYKENKVILEKYNPNEIYYSYTRYNILEAKISITPLQRQYRLEILFPRVLTYILNCNFK